MKAYIGTKIIRAEPMGEQQALVRGLVRQDEQRAQLRPGYHVVYPDGYESWSPAETFEACHRLVSEDERRSLSR